MGSVTIYKDKVHFVLREPGGLVYPYIDKKARQIVRLAKAQVGVDTGDLKSSISYTIRGGRPVYAKITASDRKAMMHHQGTSPHIIVPRKAKALRFSSHGKIVVTKKVYHPGTKANHFLTDPLRAVF